MARPRSAIADLGAGRYAVAISRQMPGSALRELGEVLHAVRLRGELIGAALVSLSGACRVLNTGDELIRLAEDLCARSTRRGGAELETVLVQYDHRPDHAQLGTG
jgi:hypothetical protein